jgi:hypothetical protein
MMKSANSRHYRRHLIIKSKSRFFGLRRFQVWDRGNLVGTFRDVVSAELHIDARLSGG